MNNTTRVVGNNMGHDLLARLTRLEQRDEDTQRHFARQDATIARQDATIAGQDATIARQDATIAGLDTTIAGHGTTIARLNVDIEELQVRVFPLRSIRATILDMHANYTALDERSLLVERNESAHGGNIIEDSILIRASTTEERESAWRKSFQRIYGFHLSAIESRIQNAPSSVIKAFNMHANCVLMDRWQLNSELRQTVLDKCKIFLRVWVFDSSLSVHQDVIQFEELCATYSSL
ncbi:hypothetical protein BDW59DRAFT_136924 [Aspergillus cavernicola]|uniref:Uncharacterized protein n=1 Tax=Aspergillus cavernicola TaxID=176166 RepID=A0ABR4J4L5_9EURO